MDRNTESSSAQLLAHAEMLSNSGCFDWDIQANHVRWSDNLFRIYGLQPQEFKATLDAFLDRVVPEDRPKVQNAVQEALETCGSFSCVERIIHTSGEIRFLESRGEVITDESGKPVRLIGVCRDITETKALETQLRYAQKMEAVGCLASGIAHDFNNLLTAIRTNAELLIQYGNLDAEAIQQSAAAVQDACMRGQRLTSQLLMFGGQGQPAEQPVNLNDHLTGSSGLLANLLGDQVSLETKLDPDLPLIKIDESHLDQILVNLTVNSRDAMPDGGSFRVETSVTRVESPSTNKNEFAAGEYVVLAVSDTGVGMTAEECEKIFDPFYTGRPKGTGLGLAVIYGIVKNCQGSIEVVSEPGGGTTFSILFPTAQLETVDRSELLDLKCRGTVLLVEDDPAVMRSTSIALRKSGITVLEATNGTAAIAIAKNNDGQIDLLLTDCAMPGLSGMEVAREIVSEYPKIGVLYMSGRTRAASDYAVPGEFIQKPSTTGHLLKKIRHALNVSRS